MELLPNGVATKSEAILLFSMRTESLASSQSCRSIDADAQYRFTLRHIHTKAKAKKFFDVCHLFFGPFRSVICLTSVTRAKCGVCSTLCWKIPNISGSTELFAL